MKVKWNDRIVLKKIDEAAEKDERKAANMIARDAKSTRLFKDVSGKLRSSIRVERSRYRGGGYLVWVGGPSAPYAPKVEFGRRGVRGKFFLLTAKKRNKRKIKKLFEGR